MIYAQPISSKFGCSVEGNLTFEPIPFYCTELNVSSANDIPYGNSHYKNKWVFTQFNLGFNAKAGLYYDLSSFRVTIGGGIAWHDPYKSYRRLVIDDVNFGQSIQRVKLSYSGFAKVSYFF